MVKASWRAARQQALIAFAPLWAIARGDQSRQVGHGARHWSALGDSLLPGKATMSRVRGSAHIGDYRDRLRSERHHPAQRGSGRRLRANAAIPCKRWRPVVRTSHPLLGRAQGRLDACARARAGASKSVRTTTPRRPPRGYRPPSAGVELLQPLAPLGSPQRLPLTPPPGSGSSSATSAPARARAEPQRLKNVRMAGSPRSAWCGKWPTSRRKRAAPTRHASVGGRQSGSVRQLAARTGQGAQGLHRLRWQHARTGIASQQPARQGVGIDAIGFGSQAQAVRPRGGLTRVEDQHRLARLRHR